MFISPLSVPVAVTAVSSVSGLRKRAISAKSDIGPLLGAAAGVAAESLASLPPAEEEEEVDFKPTREVSCARKLSLGIGAERLGDRDA